MPHPVLETTRLILRPPVESDLHRWVEFSADPDAMRFIGGVQPGFAAWRSMTSTAGSWALYGFGMFSVVERATGRWIGRVGPWWPEDWPGPEVGWGLHRDAWKRGYAVEAATAAMQWTFESLGWPEVIHLVDPENTASIAVAGRLGSARRGPVQMPAPFHERTTDLYAQTAAQWQARRQP